MAERFSEQDLQQILAILDVAEGRISTGAEIEKALDWARQEIIEYKEGGPPLYETEYDKGV